MKIAVVGAGLIGVTTAYYLQRSGHQVTVIERRTGPGEETSFANGALLHPSMPEPWNSPGCWRTLLASLGRSDAALQLRLRALPALAGWGVTFLRNSSPVLFRRNTLSNLRLALHSLQTMAALRDATGVEYGRASLGTLRVFRERPALDRATTAAEQFSSQGLSFQRLSGRETVCLEAALRPIADEVAGALHYTGDETGDAHQFCVALTEVARQEGVEFRFGTNVSSLALRSNRVMALLSENEWFVADRYIVAAGSYGVPLLRDSGIRVPVRPAKGYSITLDCAGSRPVLSIPIIDDHLHAAVVPLANCIRVAGTAEFAGYDRTLDAGRIHNLLGLLRKILPQMQFDPEGARPWCGLRPMSADGVPIIGPTPIGNLFVNTGHGHLGWTMAAGSARLLADLLCGRAPSIDPAPYELRRFFPFPPE